MKVLVTYMTQTGNTEKVAEAIHHEITVEKEIKPLQQVSSLEGYDLAFVGFPIVRFGVDASVTQFLAQHAPNKKIVLFATHAAPEEMPEVQTWLAPAVEAASKAELVGLFHCQGALSPQIKAYMLQMGDPQLRAWAQSDNSQGQPDETRLARARTFAREIMGKVCGAWTGAS